MSAYQEITNIGNGVGYIYEVGVDGTSLRQSWPNTSTNYERLLRQILAYAPKSGERRPFARITITNVSGAGNFNTLNINGVSQISGAVAATSGDPVLSAIDLADDIETHNAVSGVDYNALAYESSGDGIVLILAPDGTGDSVNGHTLSVTADPAITFTADAEVSGGSDGDQSWDASIGRRYFLNASIGATFGSISGATEITHILLPQNLYGKVQSATIVPSGDSITVERQGSRSIIEVNAGGEGVNIDQIIMDGAQRGDMITIMGISAANSINLRDTITAGGGGANIRTALGNTFLSEGPDSSMTLVYALDTPDQLDYWHDIRGRAVPPTVAELRSNSIPTSVNGTEAIVIGAGGGSFTLDPSIDPRMVDVTTSGSITLAGNATIAGTGSSELDGDWFFVSGEGSQIDPNGFTFSVFGITIPDEMAITGGWAALAFRVATDPLNTYTCRLFPTFNSRVVDTAHYVANSVDTAALGALAVTSAELAANAVETAKILDANVTTAKMSTDMKRDIYSMNVSFETGEQTAYPIRLMPWDFKVVEVYTTVTKDLAATDTGGIVTQINGVNITNGAVSIAASAPQGTHTDTTPTALNTGSSGDIINIVTSKVTAGGKAVVNLVIERT